MFLVTCTLQLGVPGICSVGREPVPGGVGELKAAGGQEGTQPARLGKLLEDEAGL